jgi:hypothetical protein
LGRNRANCEVRKNKTKEEGKKKMDYIRRKMKSKRYEKKRKL